MHRAGFLTRALGAVGALFLGRYAELLPATRSTPVPPPTFPPAEPVTNWYFLDGGSLDLGIVRDSLLEPREDWRMFGEVFESTAVIGRVEVAP